MAIKKILLSTVSIALLGAPAFAQTAPTASAAPETGLEVVVVTAKSVSKTCKMYLSRLQR
jgi:hypothetical protein